MVGRETASLKQFRIERRKERKSSTMNHRNRRTARSPASISLRLMILMQEHEAESSKERLVWELSVVDTELLVVVAVGDDGEVVVVGRWLDTDLLPLLLLH